MSSETRGGTFPEVKNVPLEKQVGPIADFLSFLCSDVPKHKPIDWNRIVEGAAIFLNEVRDVLEEINPRSGNGHISEWIAESQTWNPQFESCQALLLLLKAMGDQRNSRILRESLTEIGKDREIYLPIFQNCDLTPLNPLLKHLADNLEIQGDMQIMPDAAQLRAFQAQLRSLVFYRTYIETLIEEAKSGSKAAVLQLIRIDYLFVDDPCTKSVIYQAAEENDESFFSGIKSAFKINEKDLVRIGIYLFAASGSNPTNLQMRNLFDPEWTKFKDEGFDRFVTRARKVFREM